MQLKTEIFYPLIDDLCFRHIFSKEEVLEEFNKSVSYITRIFLGQLERGKKYLDAKKVIGLNFISENYHDNNELVNDYGFINKVNLKSLEDECLEMYLIRLDLVKKKVYNGTETRFIKWLKFIGAKDVLEMSKIAKGDEVMEQTLKFMEDFLNDKEIRDVYDKINDVERYAKEEGHTEGLAQGLAKGEHQEKIKTAKKMLQDGLNINNISKYTGLSLSEINALN